MGSIVILKATSKSTDAFVLGTVEDLAQARFFADFFDFQIYDKQKILQNAKKLKDDGIFIYKDLCSDAMELWKSLWKKVLEYRRQGKYAYLNYKTIVGRNKSWYVFCLWYLAHSFCAICYLLIVKYCCCIIPFRMNANTKESTTLKLKTLKLWSTIYQVKLVFF